MNVVFVEHFFSLYFHYLHQTTLLRESLEVGILKPIPPVNVVFWPYVDFFTGILGSWLPWIWWVLPGVWTFGNFTDWLAGRLFILYWLFLFITLFEVTIFAFPVTKAGFWLGFTACERFLFFCSSAYFYLLAFASSANLRATVLAIFLICWCLLFIQPRKLKCFWLDFKGLVLL